MREGPQFHKPRTNPDGPDYCCGGRRTPVALLEVPVTVKIQHIPAELPPKWSGYWWPEAQFPSFDQLDVDVGSGSIYDYARAKEDA